MKFLKIFFAALLASLVSGVLGMLLWVIVIVCSLTSIGASSVVAHNEPTILKIELADIYSDAPEANPFALIDFRSMKMRSSISMLGILKAIESAADDDYIEGIYLNISSYNTMPAASIEELRSALELFKQSGKFVIAYSDNYTQGAYYLSSVADKVYLQPEGMIQWQGMSTYSPFFKGLFDKLDISVEVFRPTTCRYKSAVEPYIMEGMSPENRAQMQQLIGSMWNTLTSQVALSRGLPLEEVERIAQELECMSSDEALKLKMVDALIYEDQLPDIFRNAGASLPTKDIDINYISLSSYISILTSTESFSYNADKVGIIYAEGNIVDGEGDEAGYVYGDSTAEIIRSARFDDAIKVVVLRINSPGGSALAADVMWREVELLCQAKPVIVSMGGYAASGGYYIAAPADFILADRLTLTGSIGVFGLVPNLERGLKNKLGVTFDGVATSPSASFMRTYGALSPLEKKRMGQSVDKVYDHFTSLVSQGRNIPLDEVLEIAQGRVWSGEEAAQLGLVDAVGGLREAIAVAVERAGISDNYRIVELLGEPTGINALFTGVSAAINSAIEANTTPLERQLQKVTRQVETPNGIMMYSPYRVEL